MKTAREILDKYILTNSDNWMHVDGSNAIKAMEEFAAQSPAISRERLVQLIKPCFEHKMPYEVLAAADAILSELGKPAQPAPPVTLPTDEEIHQCRLRVNGPDDDQISKSIGDTFEAGAKWMRSEIEKRMKGGNSKK